MQAVRYYGAWGDVRVGNTTGDSIWRYCASLGHVADDESGFVYMRARYYEPSSGRFASQDPARDWANWFTYCRNNPISNLDESGKTPESEALAMKGSILYLLGLCMMFGGVIAGAMCAGSYVIKLAEDMTKLGGMFAPGTPPVESLRILCELFYFGLQQPGIPQRLAGGAAGGAVLAIAGYYMMIQGQMMMTDAEFADPYSANQGLFGLF